MPNSNYPWDPYSDQPHILRNKPFKRALYRKGALSSLKTLLYIPFLFITAVRAIFTNRFQTGQTIRNIGLCVNVTQTPGEQVDVPLEQCAALVEELGVHNLLIRVPLADIETIDAYVNWVKQFQGKEILINVLQDRDHIEDPERLKQSLHTVFSKLGTLAQTFQIGNSINRKKWGFVSSKEYFHFYKVAQDIRDNEFPTFKLLGGNTIDFELPNFARSVFHLSKLKYDGIATQLYVDRRGAPENSQFGFDLAAKIKWFYDMVLISRKTSNKLYITETNWPLKGTEPFAPAVGDCMVDESSQANYLLRYYLIAIATGKVEKCYWHQLVAPGYGLIDNRGDKIRKRQAFYCFKLLVQLFQNATVLSFTEHKLGYYSLTAENAAGRVQALWANDVEMHVIPDFTKTILDLTGKLVADASGPKREGSAIRISGAPIFALDYKLSEL